MSSFLSCSLNWLQEHYIELIAVITGVVYVLFTIKENILLWLFGIISSALYIMVFLKAGIYAYAILYIYYVVIGLYGWYIWARKADEQETKSMLHIRKASTKLLLGCIGAIFATNIPVFFSLKLFTDSDLPLADAILTSGGMVATWMLTQKFIEQWLFWIVIDILSLSVMIYKGLYPSAFLFLLYTVLAFKGYFEWKKELIHA
jgi:nicotinamide mononucleotide transporter